VPNGIYFSAFSINPGKAADDPEKSGLIFPFPIGGTGPSRLGSTYEDRPAGIDLRKVANRKT
jgi:hypothetical protein